MSINKIVAASLGRMLGRRAVSAIAVGIVGVMCLSACGSTSKTSSAAASTKTVTIGAGGVLTGQYSIFSQETDAFKAYFNQINRHGGINGYKIHYIVYNDQYNPATALSIAHELVADKVLAIVGGLGGTPVDAAAYPYLSKTGIPVIAPVSAAQTFTNVDSVPYYLMVPNYSQETRLMVQFAKTRFNTSSVSISYQDDEAGIPAMDGVKYEAKKLGITYSGGVPFPDSATAYGTYAAALERLDAKTAIIWGPAEAAAAIQKACTQAGYKPHWILPFFDMELSWLSIGGTPGTYFDSWMAPVNPQHPANAAVANFVKVMNKDYPKVGPGDLPEQGWVGASIFTTALKKATAGGKAPTRKNLEAALNSMCDFSNGLITGLDYCNGNHLGAKKEIFLQNRGQSFVPVTGYETLPAPVPGS